MFVSIVGKFGRTVPRHGAAAVLFLALALTAGSASAGDDSAFVSYSGVPMRMIKGTSATVTVTMKNTGTTTWETSQVREITQGTVKTTRTSFALRAVGHDWGVGRVNVTGSVAPNAPGSFEFTITAPSAPATYAFQWRMARDTVVIERPTIPASADWGFGATTPRKLIVVEEDTAPSFKGSVPDQTWEVGKPVSVPLPEARGGNGAPRYSFSGCRIPGGVRRSGRQLSGTPTAKSGLRTCTWTVTDSDANTAASDSDSLTFTVEVKEPDTAPVLDGGFEDQTWEVGKKIDVPELPEAEGGNGPLSYSLSDCLPGGVTPTGRQLSGTPEAVWSKNCTWTVTDSDDNTSASDSDSLDFMVVVKEPPEPDTPPVLKGGFGDRAWWVDEAITPVELPEATGGNGPLLYSLSDCLPKGVTRTGRQLSGTPEAVWSEGCTWAVTDSDDNTSASDSDSLDFMVVVKEPPEPDTPPVLKGGFGDRAWWVDEAITPVELPKATGGNGPLRYSLSKCLPRGVTRTGRRLAGTPEAVTSEATCVWKVRDSDANTAASDTDSLMFTVEVALPPEPDTAPSFNGATVPKQAWLARQTVALDLPKATGGNGLLSYSLSGCQLPGGVTLAGRRLSGKPGAVSSEVTCTWKVTDSDDNAAASDSDSLAFSIEVLEPALVVAPSSLGVDEGKSDTFTVKLAARPTGTVTVTVTSGDAGAATASPASLTFTAADYGTARPVTVTGAGDDDTEDEETTVALSASGGGYGSVSASVDVTVKDDDEPALVLSREELALAEGDFGEFTVKLATRPTATVTVSVTSGEPEAAAASPSSLTFTAENYGAARKVTVLGEQDDDAEHEETTVALSASGGGYGDVSASVAVTVKDDDAPGLVVNPEKLEVREGGSGVFTVNLAARPTAAVTVSLSAASGASGAVTVDGLESLTFTTENYRAPQTVTVPGEQDDDVRDESFTLALSASGGGYDGLAASVEVTVKDDDAPALAVDPASLGVAEGESVGFSVKLATRPSGAVTVSVASGDAGAATASPPSLTFTESDYGSARTVTVTGAPDADAENESTTVALSASGGGYDDVSASVEVRVKDDDARGLVVVPEALEIEEGAEGEFTVKLATQPSADVTVSVGSGDTGAATVSPASLTFTASDYAAAQTVKVTGVRDEGSEDASATVTLSASGGGYAGVTASVSVTVTNVETLSDDASFVSYVDVPSTMRAGASTTVTVTMKNTGTTTWTRAAGYALGSQRPEDNATWGPSRVPLAVEVAPGGTVDFTFGITAPEDAGGHAFRWKMVRGADGWFGRKTALREIAVTGPSFRDAAIPDRTWVKGEPIEALTLPEAVGGDGALTYALTPAPPDGVAFTEATRTLSGTPTALRAATEYTWTATDIDDDAVSLSFTIAVEESSVDDAELVSVSGVPSRMASGHAATVTVTMKNTGTTTWTSAGGYALGSWSAGGKDTWGSRRAPLSGSVSPSESVGFTFEITAPEATGSYGFSWRMVRDPGMWFGEATGEATIIVEDPSFGDAAIPDQTWLQHEPVEALTLPEAVGGDGALTYSLTPVPPDGVSFDATTRTLSGTPTTARDETEYAYTATDEQGKAATLTFSITVEAASVDGAEFVSISGVPSRMAAGGSATVTVTMKNAGTTTWTAAGGYALGARNAGGKDTWGPRRAPLSGSVAPNESFDFTFAIAAPEATGSYAFSWQMVRDPGGWFGAATGDLRVTVEDPSFGDAAIPDQTWVRGAALKALTLPAASGGDGGLTYSLTPALPDGVSFDAATRVLSGTPATARAATAYAYTATDKDGDAATLAFTITVSRPSSTAESSAALGPGTGEEDAGASAPAGVFDMFEYWLAPHGSGMRIRARRGEVRLPVEAGAPVPALAADAFADDGGRVLGEAELAPAGGRPAVRSVWRGDLWGRKVALLGDPGGGRYDIFEEAGDRLDYWGTFEGGAAGDGGVQADGDRLSRSLDRPFRWMNRFMAVGDVLESRVTGRLLSNRDRNQASVVETTMRLEVLSHRASFTIPVSDGPTFEDVLVVRFWPDAALPEVHDTFHLARGFGAVHWRRSPAEAPGEVAEWWAVEKAPARVVPSGPPVPWFDPFSPGWPKTAVVNGNLEDLAGGAEGAAAGSFAAPGWTADSADAVIARSPPGLAGGAWSLLLRGGGGDGAADAATTGEWIPVEGGTYRLSACMLRENAADNVVVDFDDGKGRDADFADAHLVAASTGAWECRAVTKCIPASVGAVRVRAARDGANLGDAWFDRVELKRIAACAAPPRAQEP